MQFVVACFKFWYFSVKRMPICFKAIIFLATNWKTRQQLPYSIIVSLKHSNLPMPSVVNLPIHKQQISMRSVEKSLLIDLGFIWIRSTISIAKFLSEFCPYCYWFNKVRWIFNFSLQLIANLTSSEYAADIRARIK